MRFDLPKALLIFLGTLLIAGESLAQWGTGRGGSCPLPMPSMRTSNGPPIGPASLVPGYRWHSDPQQPEFLFCVDWRGDQRGALAIETGVYQPYDGRGFGRPCQPPIPAPTNLASRQPPATQTAPKKKRCACGDLCPCKECDCEATGKQCCESCKVRGQLGRELPPTGVFSAQIERDKFSVGGQEVDPRAFFAAPPDDTSTPYVFVLGDKGFQEAARKKIASLPERDRLLVSYRDPSNWVANSPPGAYRPGITIYGERLPNGRAREKHYQADVEGLDVAVANALRTPAPDYDPKRTPDLRVPPQPPANQPGGLPLWAWVLLGLGAVLLLGGSQHPTVKRKR